MKVYSLKSCDTCRKAVKALQAAREDVEVVDIRADGLSEARIEQIIAAVGWDAALNRRSTTWRGLEDGDKQALNDAKAARLIAAHPTLLKRPAITDGTTTTVGWKDDAQARWL